MPSNGMQFPVGQSICNLVGMDGQQTKHRLSLPLGSLIVFGCVWHSGPASCHWKPERSPEEVEQQPIWRWCSLSLWAKLWCDCEGLWIMARLSRLVPNFWKNASLIYGKNPRCTWDNCLPYCSGMVWGCDNGTAHSKSHWCEPWLLKSIGVQQRVQPMDFDSTANRWISMMGGETLGRFYLEETPAARCRCFMESNHIRQDVKVLNTGCQGCRSALYRLSIWNIRYIYIYQNINTYDSMHVS